MSRAAPLTVLDGGIDRRRTRGAARADVLYDLQNGYVTEVGTAVSRPGTSRIATLDSLTRGLMSFQDSLHVFCHTEVVVPDGFTLHILQHPDARPGYEVELEKIHFAQPFLGVPYVVAEFADGVIRHFWLERGETWQANTVYYTGDLVEPEAENGHVYGLSRLGSPYPMWEANVPRYDGTDGYNDASIVEPTVANDFYYVCIDAQGSNPRSGTVEPTWPTTDGATVLEEVDNGEVVSGTPTAVDVTAPAVPSNATQERYGFAASAPSGRSNYQVP